MKIIYFVGIRKTDNKKTVPSYERTDDAVLPPYFIFPSRKKPL